MKLLMLIVDGSRKEELEVLLNRSGVLGYTEIPRTVGVGSTGMRLGSRAFPKTSAVIFTVLADDALEKLAHDVKEYCKECGEQLKMVVWGVEEVR
jgi:Nitrogen regulatory protein P-II